MWVLIACLIAPLFVRFPASQPMTENDGSAPAPTFAQRDVVFPASIAAEHVSDALAELP
jgi:hypothetical protein